MKKMVKLWLMMVTIVLAMMGYSSQSFAADSIIEQGTGLPGIYTGAQGRLMARRAAITDCYRNLAARIQGVQVNADTTVKGLMVENDTINTNISGLIKGAKIVEEKQLPDGSYTVTMEVPMYGATDSVAAVVIPAVRESKIPTQTIEVSRSNTVLPKAEYKTAKQGIYSGIIIDASKIGLETTMAPQIIDTNGRIIYGLDNINMDVAVSQGLVEYSSNLTNATAGNTRAGNTALVIKAAGVKGGSNSVNPVNVVVTPEDADRILLAMQNDDSIALNGKITFVR